MTEEEKQRIIEELKLQKAYAHKFNNPQIKMITGCALKLIQEQDRIIKNQSYTNKKMKKKLDNYRKLVKLKERTIQKQDTEINKLNNVIDKYRQEREYIKNNLEIDLQRKGVLAQAKGQIAQILDYYKRNDEYFMKERRGEYE